MIPVKYNVRSLLVRRTNTLMTAGGVALVVMILFILLGFVAGLRSAVLRSARADNWIVLSRSVTAEPSSFVTREQYDIIRVRSEIEHDSAGHALVSPEIVTAFNPAPDGPLRLSSFTYLRGVQPVAFQVHRGIRIVNGRLLAAGQPEMIVGVRLAARFPDLKPGNEIHFGRGSWPIVGVFSDGGSARESEVWTDLDVLQQDVHFGNGFSDLHVTMKPGMGPSFDAALERDARLRLDAMPEDRFYALQSQLADQLRGLGLIVAVILGVGAIFGGMNTMYSAVARRAREVGVLRAIGFSRAAILFSFVLESMVLALAGGVLGEILGVAVASATGLNSRLMNVQMLMFSFRLTPSAFVSGLAAALAIGALGGLLPAWRAARLGVIDSIRAA
ncbi:MAG TPA: FtsX-like permease family protein [Candidatus Acidoferrales bacterium]|nr:FtsX-like permease family protein [Candidatus Acidoferrales bacterium]